MRILRVTPFDWTGEDGTRVPKTTVVWEDDVGAVHALILQGHVSLDEAEREVSARGRD